MAKLAMNKSALHKENQRLRLYRRVLPSLEIKRRQLTLEAGRARKALEEVQAEVEELNARIGEKLPMLANQEIEVAGLVQIESLQIEEENIVSVKIPVLADVHCTVRDYAMMAKPHWIDVLVDYLQRAATLRIKEQVMAERWRRLDLAMRRTTQRVNLFEKILIPTAEKNIQRIRIFLGDGERAAIVRSKIAKAMQQRRGQRIADEGGA